MASWLVCSSLDRAVRVQALAGDIALCSWARHFAPFSNYNPGQKSWDTKQVGNQVIFALFVGRNVIFSSID